MDRKLVSTVPDLVARTDLAGNIVYINETGITMSGYATANDVLGKSVFSFFSPEDFPRAIGNTKQMFARQLGPVSTARGTCISNSCSCRTAGR